MSGQYTGLTDLPLTERGERNARRLEERLRGLTFAKVFTSPLQRAKRTCELAGFGAIAEIDGDLVEWNYGDYEGRHSADVHRELPDWELFRDGCPGGESPGERTFTRSDCAKIIAESISPPMRCYSVAFGTRNKTQSAMQSATPSFAVAHMTL